jgi:hypothetical protein
MIIKITLDTNCFFEYYDRGPSLTQELIQELIDFQEKNIVEIAMTTRVMADTYDKWKGEGNSPIWTKIQSFPVLAIVGTVFRFDMSRFDYGDFLSSEIDMNTIERLRRIITEAQLEDVDHLFGHIKAKRDIFVTCDHHFLDHQEQLMKNLDVVVLNPKDTFRKIKNAISVKSNSQ